MHTKTFPAWIKADAGEAGTFEAIVAVFGNTDLGGDRIVAGAFADTLADWQASGDPIPVIHSHQWQDLGAHVGAVDPADARELLPGDRALPPELAELGGLYVKGTLDIADDDGAAKVFRLMTQRRLKEFSFAYDIRPGGSKRARDGVLELSALDLIEVGPTLKGMNPATALIGAKAAAMAGDPDHEAEWRTVADLLGVDNADTVADAVAKAFGVKAWATLDGSIEALLSEVAAAARAWAADLYGDDLYWAYLEATFPDRAIVYVELWDEPAEGGTFYEVAYTLDGADPPAVILGDATAVTLELTVTPKAHQLAPRAKQARGEPMTAPPATTDRATTSANGDVTLRSSVLRELIELELSDD